MIVGRNPRKPVIGDTVLLWADKTRGVGTIVDTDAITYKVYWRNGRGTLSWHARGELTVPRIDYVPVSTSSLDGCRSLGGRK
jgi:hypothetical protein